MTTEEFQGFDDAEELDIDEELDLTGVRDMRLQDGAIYLCEITSWKYYVNRDPQKNDWINFQLTVQDESHFGRTTTDTLWLSEKSLWKIRQLRAAIDDVPQEEVKSVRAKDASSWEGSQVNVRMGQKMNNQTKKNYIGPIEYLPVSTTEAEW